MSKTKIQCLVLFNSYPGSSFTEINLIQKKSQKAEIRIIWVILYCKIIYVGKTVS